MDRPLGLLAELTYGCPLSCPYCSNPLNLGDYHDELTTAEWQRVLGEAQELGVLQLHLSGGEPLLRRDLVEIVKTADELGLYTNLITSAIGLSRRRAEQLRAAGLDHVQISIQADEPAVSDRIAGTPSFERKVEAAHRGEGRGAADLNVVLHRQNIDRVADLLRLAEEVEADRVELANTQYYGWALRNRDALLPSKAQLERAERSFVPPGRAWRDGWTSAMSSPTTTASIPSPAWAGGKAGSSPSRLTVMRCPAPPRTRFLPRANVREDSLRGSGRNRRSSSVSAGRTGCRSPAEAATGVRSTSVGAAARRSSSRAMPRTDPVCHHHLTTGSWPRRCRPQTRGRGQ